MSHFTNVTTLLEGDTEELAYLIEHEDAEELADDIMYILTTVFSSMNQHERKRIKNKLIEEITEHDFSEMTGGNDGDD